MKLKQRINFLAELGNYLSASPPGWEDCVEKAFQHNPWFTPAFTKTAAESIVQHMLQPAILEAFAARYPVPDEQINPKKVGIVMAGNIPFAGFHDVLCGFLAGHRLVLKFSEKATILIEHLLQQLIYIEPAIAQSISSSVQLKNCDAYIATGSNNSARYFEYYFGKYPSIIRHNRTGVAILKGNESTIQLEQLADDIHLYFGLGCRNVTKLYVPEQYNFVPLLDAFSKYDYFKDHNKYRNNYEYQLALLILNKQYYMTNNVALLTENKALFSPVSQLHYEYYATGSDPLQPLLLQSAELQCIVGEGHIPFGQAQFPAIDDFADGADTMQFFTGLS
jgi:Acyl-CoA reductase (LuxC)